MKSCFLIVAAFLLSTQASVFAQESRVGIVSSANKSGTNIYVFDRRGENALENVQVAIVMGKDTAEFKTDRNGHVHFGGTRTKTSVITVIVSHPEYITQKEDLRAMRPNSTARMNKYFYLKPKENAKPAEK